MGDNADSPKMTINFEDPNFHRKTNMKIKNQKHKYDNIFSSTPALKIPIILKGIIDEIVELSKSNDSEKYLNMAIKTKVISSYNCYLPEELKPIYQKINVNTEDEKKNVEIAIILGFQFKTFYNDHYSMAELIFKKYREIVDQNTAYGIHATICFLNSLLDNFFPFYEQIYVDNFYEIANLILNKSSNNLSSDYQNFRIQILYILDRFIKENENSYYIKEIIVQNIYNKSRTETTSIISQYLLSIASNYPYLILNFISLNLNIPRIPFFSKEITNQFSQFTDFSLIDPKMFSELENLISLQNKDNFSPSLFYCFISFLPTSKKEIFIKDHFNLIFPNDFSDISLNHFDLIMEVLQFSSTLLSNDYLERIFQYLYNSDPKIIRKQTRILLFYKFFKISLNSEIKQTILNIIYKDTSKLSQELISLLSQKKILSTESCYKILEIIEKCSDQNKQDINQNSNILYLLQVYEGSISNKIQKKLKELIKDEKFSSLVPALIDKFQINLDNQKIFLIEQMFEQKQWYMKNLCIEKSYPVLKAISPSLKCNYLIKIKDNLQKSDTRLDIFVFDLLIKLLNLDMDIYSSPDFNILNDSSSLPPKRLNEENSNQEIKALIDKILISVQGLIKEYIKNLTENLYQDPQTKRKKEFDKIKETLNFLPKMFLCFFAYRKNNQFVNEYIEFLTSSKLHDIRCNSPEQFYYFNDLPQITNVKNYMKGFRIIINLCSEALDVQKFTKACNSLCDILISGVHINELTETLKTINCIVHHFTPNESRKIENLYEKLIFIGSKYSFTKRRETNNDDPQPYELIFEILAYMGYKKNVLDKKQMTQKFISINELKSVKSRNIYYFQIVSSNLLEILKNPAQAKNFRYAYKSIISLLLLIPNFEGYCKNTLQPLIDSLVDELIDSPDIIFFKNLSEICSIPILRNSSKLFSRLRKECNKDPVFISKCLFNLINYAQISDETISFFQYLLEEKNFQAIPCFIQTNPSKFSPMFLEFIQANFKSGEEKIDEIYEVFKQIAFNYDKMKKNEFIAFIVTSIKKFSREKYQNIISIAYKSTKLNKLFSKKSEEEIRKQTDIDISGIEILKNINIQKLNIFSAKQEENLPSLENNYDSFIRNVGKVNFFDSLQWFQNLSLLCIKYSPSPIIKAVYHAASNIKIMLKPLLNIAFHSVYSKNNNNDNEDNNDSKKLQKFLDKSIKSVVASLGDVPAPERILLLELIEFMDRAGNPIFRITSSDQINENPKNSEIDSSNEIQTKISNISNLIFKDIDEWINQFTRICIEYLYLEKKKSEHDNDNTNIQKENINVKINSILYSLCQNTDSKLNSFLNIGFYQLYINFPHLQSFLAQQISFIIQGDLPPKQKMQIMKLIIFMDLIEKPIIKSYAYLLEEYCMLNYKPAALLRIETIQLMLISNFNNEKMQYKKEHAYKNLISAYSQLQMAEEANYFSSLISKPSSITSNIIQFDEENKYNECYEYYEQIKNNQDLQLTDSEKQAIIRASFESNHLENIPSLIKALPKTYNKKFLKLSLITSKKEFLKAYQSTHAKFSKEFGLHFNQGPDSVSPMILTAQQFLSLKERGNEKSSDFFLERMKEAGQYYYHIKPLIENRIMILGRDNSKNEQALLLKFGRKNNDWSNHIKYDNKLEKFRYFWHLHKYDEADNEITDIINSASDKSDFITLKARLLIDKYSDCENRYELYENEIIPLQKESSKLDVNNIHYKTHRYLATTTLELAHYLFITSKREEDKAKIGDLDEIVFKEFFKSIQSDQNHQHVIAMLEMVDVAFDKTIKFPINFSHIIEDLRKVNTHDYLTVLPQLLSYSNLVDAPILFEILEELFIKFPEEVIYFFLMEESISNEHITNLLSKIEANAPIKSHITLIQDSRTVCSELCYVASPLDFQILSLLQNICCHSYVNIQELESIQTKIKKCNCSYDQFLMKSYPEEIENIINKILSLPNISNSLKNYEINKMKEPQKHLNDIIVKVNLNVQDDFKGYCDFMMKVKTSSYKKHFSSFGSKLASKDNKQKYQAPVFGTKIRINSFKDEFFMMESNFSPFKITINGDDGNEYDFLLKSSQDLRLDQRITQYLRILTEILPAFLFQLTTENVFPLNKNTGIITWLNNFESLHNIIYNYRKINDIKSEDDNKISKCLKNTRQSDIDFQVKNLKRIEKETNDMKYHLRDAFWKKASNSTHWFNLTNNFIKSTAINSIAGYIIGLGDRHAKNLLISSNEGKVVHIDFGDVFDKNLSRDNFPEKVPFRLTRNIVAAFGPCGINGTFLLSCNATMQALRDHSQQVISTLAIFRRNPIFDNEILDENTKNKNIIKNLDTVYLKVTGNRKTIPVNQQVDELIKKATDPNNLFKMYLGWKPLL